MFSQGSFETQPKTESLSVMSLCVERSTDEQFVELMGDGHRNATRILAQEFLSGQSILLVLLSPSWYSTYQCSMCYFSLLMYEWH